MTRVNLVDPSLLHVKHLVAEKYEIVRIPLLVRRAQDRYGTASEWRAHSKQPSSYTMGTGHVIFFYDKLQFIMRRYKQVCEEMRRRGYQVNELTRKELLGGIHKSWINDWVPSRKEKQISKQRLAEKIASWENGT